MKAAYIFYFLIIYNFYLWLSPLESLAHNWELVLCLIVCPSMQFLFTLFQCNPFPRTHLLLVQSRVIDHLRVYWRKYQDRHHLTLKFPLWGPSTICEKERQFLTFVCGLPRSEPHHLEGQVPNPLSLRPIKCPKEGLNLLVTNFIRPYLYQFFNDSHGLNGYKKLLKRPFNRC